jgi:hypothetical protein
MIESSLLKLAGKSFGWSLSSRSEGFFALLV